MLRVQTVAGCRELKRGWPQAKEANQGFQERQEAVFVGPPGLDCRLLIDDSGSALGSWWLDVSPDPKHERKPISPGVVRANMRTAGMTRRRYFELLAEV